MDGRKKAARGYAAQSMKEYLYGALAIIWIFFAMLIASDGMIAVGVIGSVAVGLVIAGVAYILGDYEQ